MAGRAADTPAVVGSGVPLSEVTGCQVTAGDGQVLGHVMDVVARLRDGEHPLVTGLVLLVGRHGPRVFLPIDHVVALGGATVEVSSAAADLRPFQQRAGEVLLHADVLGHRLIDTRSARFVRAGDLRLEQRDDVWLLRGVDVREHTGLARMFAVHKTPPVCLDWLLFEPLIGHTGSGHVRRPVVKARRFKPPQIADLLEDASKAEEDEILADVRVDPELEADVFEELDPDLARRLLVERTDEQIASVLARMDADDAADALAELPQQRRQPVLDLLPEPARRQIMTLMGFHPTSAGGLMGVDLLAVRPEATAGEALAAVTAAKRLSPVALHTIYLVDEQHRLLGSVPLSSLIQADADLRLSDIADLDPVAVGPDADVEDVAILMADYNLVTVPVVDDRRLLGVITVDDLLEAVIPEPWRRRGPPAPPGTDDRVQRTADGDDDTASGARQRP